MNPRRRPLTFDRKPLILDEPADETPFDPDLVEETPVSKSDRIARLRSKASHPAYGFTAKQKALVEEILAEADSE